jgi:hypothetical protein
MLFVAPPIYPAKKKEEKPPRVTTSENKKYDPQKHQLVNGHDCCLWPRSLNPATTNPKKLCVRAKHNKTTHQTG